MHAINKNKEGDHTTQHAPRTWVYEHDWRVKQGVTNVTLLGATHWGWLLSTSPLMKPPSLAHAASKSPRTTWHTLVPSGHAVNRDTGPAVRAPEESKKMKKEAGGCRTWESEGRANCSSTCDNVRIAGFFYFIVLQDMLNQLRLQQYTTTVNGSEHATHT